MILDELKKTTSAAASAVYNPEFCKEAKKTHMNKKDSADSHRKERNFWLFSLAAFTEHLTLIWAKPSGSETITNTITGLQEFHTRLLGNFLLYFNITKNIVKAMKGYKLFDPVKEEELSPAAKRAKAVEAQERPTGISLP